MRCAPFDSASSPLPLYPHAAHASPQYRRMKYQIQWPEVFEGVLSRMNNRSTQFPFAKTLCDYLRQPSWSWSTFFQVLQRWFGSMLDDFLVIRTGRD